MNGSNKLTHLDLLAIFTPKCDGLVSFIIMNLKIRPQEHTIKF